MVSPHNDPHDPSMSLLVKQDSLNNLNLNKFHSREDEPARLFAQNPSSSSSSSIVLGNSDLKEMLHKTSIENAWNEIFNDNDISTNNNNSMCFHEQLSLGETTTSTIYEHVLVRDDEYINDQNSLVISPQPLMSIDPMAMDDSPSFNVPEIGNYLDNSNQLLEFPALPLHVERKQCKSTNETMEKSAERRQRRMIKNRESAARSRAKKLAYTNKLEDRVSELRRRNRWLKQLKEAETALNWNQQAAPRYQLRRTTSSSF